MIESSFGQITTEPFLDLPGHVNSAEVSRDGTQVALVWWPPEERNWGIYVVPLPRGEPKLFASTNDRGLALSPKWSPDGKWIAFLRTESNDGAILVVTPRNGGRERYLGVTCGDSFTWSGDSSAVIASSRESASSARCGLAAYSILPGAGSRALGVEGGSPVLSEDGTTVAFVRTGEIGLLPVTPQGATRGPEAVITKESARVASLAWVPGVNQLAYVSTANLSRVKFVDIKGNPLPSAGGDVDGEVTSLSSSIKGDLLGTVEVHSNSYWAIDLRSADLRPVLRRLLPWNVTSTAVDRSGEQFLYSVSSGSFSSAVYLSSVSDSRSDRLFETPYAIDSLSWASDLKRIALIGHSGVGQLEPGRLYLTPGPGTVPMPFGRQWADVNAVAWTPDGKDLLLAAAADDRPSLWRLGLDRSGLSKVDDLQAQEIQASRDGKNIYVRRRFGDLVQIPIAGGAEVRVASGALEFAVGDREVYIERQDSRPPSAEGLALYRVDSPGSTPKFVAKLGFLASSMSLFSHGQQLGIERRDPPQERLVRIKGWHN